MINKYENDEEISRTNVVYSQTKEICLDNPTQKRRQVIQTMCLYWAFIVYGVVTGLAGPTLLDLQLVTKASVEVLAYAVTARSVGMLVGNILFCYIYHRCNAWLTFALSLLLVTCVTAFLPWSGHAIILSVVFFIQGGAMGLISTGGNVMLIHIWEEHNGPWMLGLQALHSLGSFFGPLISKPFLQEQILLGPIDWLKINMTHNANNASSDDILIMPHADNYSDIILLNGKYYSVDSQVWKAYSIAAAMAFVGVLLFLTIYICTRSSSPRPKSNIAQHKGILSPDMTGKLPYIIVIANILFVFFYGVLHITLSLFLMVYSTVYLGWSKSSSASLMSAFFCSITATRFVCAILIRYIKPGLYVLVSILICNISIICALSFIQSSFYVLWICSIICAVSFSGLFPANLTWLSVSIGITAKLGTVIFVSFNLGLIIGPALTAPLIGLFTEEAILFIILGAASFSMFFILMTYIFILQLKPHLKSQGVI